MSQSHVQPEVRSSYLEEGEKEADHGVYGVPWRHKA